MTDINIDLTQLSTQNSVLAENANLFNSEWRAVVDSFEAGRNKLSELETKHNETLTKLNELLKRASSQQLVAINDVSNLTSRYNVAKNDAASKSKKYSDIAPPSTQRGPEQPDVTKARQASIDANAKKDETKKSLDRAKEKLKTYTSAIEAINHEIRETLMDLNTVTAGLSKFDKIENIKPSAFMISVRSNVLANKLNQFLNDIGSTNDQGAMAIYDAMLANSQPGQDYFETEEGKFLKYLLTSNDSNISSLRDEVQATNEEYEDSLYEQMHGTTAARELLLEKLKTERNWITEQISKNRTEWLFLAHPGKKNSNWTDEDYHDVVKWDQVKDADYDNDGTKNIDEADDDQDMDNDGVRNDDDKNPFINDKLYPDIKKAAKDNQDTLQALLDRAAVIDNQMKNVESRALFNSGDDVTD